MTQSEAHTRPETAAPAGHRGALARRLRQAASSGRARRAAAVWLEVPAPFRHAAPTEAALPAAEVERPAVAGSLQRALAHILRRAARRHRGAPAGGAEAAAVREAAMGKPSRTPTAVDLERARQEVEAARGVFDWVTEPRLVDEAIFRLRAAEIQLDNLVYRLEGRRTVKSQPSV